ncbi:hypothetical protein WJX74_006538 [Apatococcus lobatus]|uniref:Uncharacterized protein n=1 Tax=Apatococcus lobatus TaxID=904363 RepID=A0AAW1RBV5_9CHLO
MQVQALPSSSCLHLQKPHFGPSSWLCLRPCRELPVSLKTFRQPRAHLECTAVRQDEVLRSMSENGEVSILTVDGTQLVSEACRRHHTAPTASAALGRALLGVLLMGCFKAEGETTQATFNGDGILKGLQVIGTADGLVKGKVGNPLADPPLRPDGKLNVGSAVGKGVLAIVRNHEKWARPYTGLVPIVTGEVGDDLASYLVESEQSNSALGLGVSIHKDASVRAAGGFLIQVLPNASEETLQQLEQNLAGVTSVTSLLHEGATPLDIAKRLLANLGMTDVQFSLQPRYGPCDRAELRDRMKRVVALLGEDEVNRILEQEGKIEVKCEFCQDLELFDKAEVEPLIQQAKPDPALENLTSTPSAGRKVLATNMHSAPAKDYTAIRE